MAASLLPLRNVVECTAVSTAINCHSEAALDKQLSGMIEGLCSDFEPSQWSYLATLEDKFYRWHRS